MSKSSSKNGYFTMDTLHKYKNKPLYEVPDDYFEQLQQNVMQHITKEHRRTKTAKRWFSAVSVAASIAIIVTLTFYVFVNKDVNEHFYVHEDITQSEEIFSNLYSNQLAEAKEFSIATPVESVESLKPLSKVPLVAETIAYRAVDYYLDDYTTDSFCEVMYDLECYYDY